MRKRIALDLTFLPYPPPRGLLRYLGDLLADINRYPSGSYRGLREKYAEYAGLIAENVIPGNGLDELIDIVTRVWGEEVLIPVPTFSEFEHAARRRGSRLISADCLRGDIYQLTYTPEQLSSSTLVWICSPNNPSGSSIPRETIRSILARARGIVVVDECYYEYAGQTVADLIGEYENLVVLRSLSKTFGLAGVRLGFALARLEHIQTLETYRQIFNVNRLAEAAGEVVFEYLEYYQHLWERVKRSRSFFCQALDRLGFCHLDSQANFVLVGLKNRNEAERLYTCLEEEGVATFPGWSEEFSGLEDRYIRFGIGTEEEMEETVRILENIGSL